MSTKGKNLFGSIKSKAKAASEKASSVIADEYHKQQQKAADRNEQKALAIASEEARKKSILAGKIEPIQVTLNLENGENAYLSLPARRMAAVDSVISHTTGSSKKKHVIRRGIVGGALMFPVAPLGVLAGAATAGSKQKSTTTQLTVSSIRQVDVGQFILTDRRIVFVGSSNVISLPYVQVLAAGFNKQQAHIKYAGMLNNEYFELLGPIAKDATLYYTGIAQKNIELKE